MKCYLERFAVQINLCPKSSLIHSALEEVPWVLQESVSSMFCGFKQVCFSECIKPQSFVCVCEGQWACQIPNCKSCH